MMKSEEEKRSNSEKSKPNIRQRKFIESVVNSDVNETNKAIITKLGISEDTFYKWKKRFSEEIKEATSERFQGNKSRWFRAIDKKARSGDVQALKLVFEMTGEYVPFSKSEIEAKLNPQINVTIMDSDVPNTHSDSG